MISVTYSKPNFILSFDYNKTDLKIVRELPVREWNKEKKYWTVPELVVHTLDGLTNLNWEDNAWQVRNSIKKAILRLIDYKFADNENIDGYLRPYQQTGVDFLCNAKKALLADDMGLGKSVQALQTLITLGTERNLIICPATLKLNWDNEFKKHFNIDPIIISGNAAQRKEKWNSVGKYFIANYDILARDWMDMPKEWDAIVCDEAVYLKNHSAQRTKLVKKLKSDVKIALSGMPIENQLMDLHSIIDWIRPEIIPSLYRFKGRYVDYAWNGSILGYKNIDELHMMTSPFILRRKKENVLKELPPKIHTDFPLEMDIKSKRAYKAIVNEFIQWLNEQTGKNWHASALEKIIRLRQFVEFPEIVGFDNLVNIKLQWLKDAYQNVGKLVVFTYFRGSVNLLQKEFNTDFILTGGTPQDERIPMVDRFNEAESGMFILTDAGKFGLNITGASHIANFGYFYNPATMIQREDRLHRIGQKDTVNVMNPYIINSIDEGIRDIFLKRAASANDFMDGSEKMSISKLTKKDFKRMVFGNGKY